MGSGCKQHFATFNKQIWIDDTLDDKFGKAWFLRKKIAVKQQLQMTSY